MNKTQKKKKITKKLGMGLSSLLSSDEGLASVVKAKIEDKVSAFSTTSKSNNKKTTPSLNIIKNNLDKKIGKIETREMNR